MKFSFKTVHPHYLRKSYLFWIKSIQILTFISINSHLTTPSFSQSLPSPPQPDFPTTPIPETDSPLRLPPFSPSPTPTLAGNLFVTRIEFIDNTVFSNQTLGQIRVFTEEIPIADLENQTLEFSELLQIAAKVAEYYAKKGYRTSGAVVVIPEETREAGEGIVKIQVIEGTLSDIQVSIQDKNVLDARFDFYVRSRLGVKENRPLNVDKLLESLQLLQLDPQIKRISATLSPATETGQSNLIITYQPNNPLTLSVLLDNGRSPSVGSFQRGASFRYDNVLGLGDKIRIGYLNSDGSDRPEASYEIPFNGKNGTIRFDYVHSDSEIIEPPFDDLNEDGIRPDIKSNYDAYDLTLRQPIIRSIKNQTYTEFALGINGSWRRTQSFLFGEPFPFSLSADILGNTRIFALRFSQDFLRQNATEIYAFNSQLSVGLDAFGSTISPQVPEIDIADSQFVAWRGQGQYVRLLAPNTIWIVRSNLQFADRPLLPIEQFSTGGLGSVRGYRQDQLLTDNGFFASTEIRFPVLKIPDGENEGVLQVIPFVDYGVGWNTSLPSPNDNYLVSLGLGFLWQLGDFSARLDWGIPLINSPRDRRTWNENGLYFTIEYGNF